MRRRAIPSPPADGRARGRTRPTIASRKGRAATARARIPHVDPNFCYRSGRAGTKRHLIATGENFCESFRFAPVRVRRAGRLSMRLPPSPFVCSVAPCPATSRRSSIVGRARCSSSVTHAAESTTRSSCSGTPACSLGRALDAPMRQRNHVGVGGSHPSARAICTAAVVARRRAERRMIALCFAAAFSANFEWGGLIP